MKTQHSHFSLVWVSSKFTTSPYCLQLSSAWESKVQFWTFTLTNSQLAVKFHSSSWFSPKTHQCSTFFVLLNNIIDSISSLRRAGCSSFLCSQGARIIDFFIHMLSASLGTQLAVSQEQDWMSFLDWVSLWIVMARRLQPLPRDIMSSTIWLYHLDSRNFSEFQEVFEEGETFLHAQPHQTNESNVLDKLISFFMVNNPQENIMSVGFTLVPRRIKVLQSGEFNFVFQETKKKKAKEICGEI